jgi:deoxyribodipyrimidine photo-lyase
MAVRPDRIRVLTPTRPEPMGSGPVVYWINRDRRRDDNWALLYAQQVALQRRVPLIAVFCLVPTFLDATLRQYDFMIRGLEELERDLAEINVGFRLILGNPKDVLLPFLESTSPSMLVTDFEPLRIKKQWIDDVIAGSSVPFHQVDAHNIVPCWVASPKLEFAAYTIRPKITKLLPTYLEEFPSVERHPFEAPHSPQTDWSAVRSSLRVNSSIGPVSWLTPGPAAGRARLDAFVSKIELYADRNDPTKPGQSNLSPYFHFGQLAPQRAALATPQAGEHSASFLEELIIRRELSDNFTYYNDRYDSFDGMAAWAQQTLNDHRNDPRDYVYSLEQWEGARIHDELWNAAQNELITTGKLHGFMRMYWAKKILEWSSSPDEALAIGIYLNDAYALDGRDPNGYVGVAWSVGGVHDRAWFERPVYGKIRYMNANGCARKFDVKSYIRRYAQNTLL